MEKDLLLEYIMRTEELTRVFRAGSETVYALRNVSIRLERGKLNMLRGRSGSGKTTLVNLLGALDSPDSGKIYFNDMDITSASEAEKNRLRKNKMGFVFQSVALISMMSAYENVEFNLRVAGSTPRALWKKRIEECLDLVGQSGPRQTKRRAGILPAEAGSILSAQALPLH